MSTVTATGTGWQLEDNAAEAYQAYLVPAIFQAMSRRLVVAADVRDGHRVLDVACGTGVVARAAARRVGADGSVVGVDINPGMLATAERASAEVTPAIEFRQGDAAELPFEDDTFDVVLCEEALQFLPDRVGALSEMRRVAVPGGRVAVSVLRSLDHHPVYAIFSRTLGEYAGPEAEQMMGSPFALGDAGVLRQEARQAGLDGVEIRIAVSEERFPSVEELVRQEAASSPLAGPLGELEPDRQAALVAALTRDLAPWCDDAGLAFHNETHILTATT